MFADPIDVPSVSFKQIPIFRYARSLSLPPPVPLRSVSCQTLISGRFELAGSPPFAGGRVTDSSGIVCAGPSERSRTSLAGRRRRVGWSHWGGRIRCGRRGNGRRRRCRRRRGGTGLREIDGDKFDQSEGDLLFGCGRAARRGDVAGRAVGVGVARADTGHLDILWRGIRWRWRGLGFVVRVHNQGGWGVGPTSLR